MIKSTNNNSLENSNTILLFDFNNFIDRYLKFSYLCNTMPYFSYPYEYMSCSFNFELIENSLYNFCNSVISLRIPSKNIYFIFDGCRDSKGGIAMKKKKKRQIKKFHDNSTSIYPQSSIILHDLLVSIDKNFNVGVTTKYDADTTIIEIVNIIKNHNYLNPHLIINIIIFSGDRGFNYLASNTVGIVNDYEVLKISKYNKENSVNKLYNYNKYNYDIKLYSNKKVNSIENIYKFLNKTFDTSYDITNVTKQFETYYAKWQIQYISNLNRQTSFIGYTIKDILINKGSIIKRMIKFYAFIYKYLHENLNNNNNSNVDYIINDINNLNINNSNTTSYNKSIEMNNQEYYIKYIDYNYNKNNCIWASTKLYINNSEEIDIKNFLNFLLDIVKTKSCTNEYLNKHNTKKYYVYVFCNVLKYNLEDTLNNKCIYLNADKNLYVFYICKFLCLYDSSLNYYECLKKVFFYYDFLLKVNYKFL